MVLSDLQVLTEKKLSNVKGIRHGFFTRKGGVSDGIYSSLNVGYGSNDTPCNVTKNRQIIIDTLGAESLNSVYQVHGNKVVRVYNGWSQEGGPKADAMVTDKPGTALGILTADCAPILFCDPKTKVIGATHAGWRGALAGVAEATIEAMCKIGAQPNNMIAAIGPTIGPRSYEVSASFLKPFLEQDRRNSIFFQNATQAKYFLFDLPSYITSLIKKKGLTNVRWTGHDTFADKDRFFSYRYSRFRGQEDYGRMLSVIMIA